MSKKSGFAVKITAFIEADPKDMKSMSASAAAVEDANSLLRAAAFIAVEVESRFMLSKEVADEPKPADPLAIPAHMRRA